MKVHFFSIYLILVLAAFGCSVDISQSSVATSTPQEGVVPATVFPTNSATGRAPGQNTTAIPSLPTKKIAITWANLNLTGRLIYIAADVQNNKLFFNIQSLDLTTGIITTIFQIPADGWADGVTVSRDGKQMVISYSLPINAVNGGRELLYIMPVDASQPPQLLFPPQSDTDQYFQPDWSPDGKYIYFTHIRNGGSPPYEIMRIAYPNGKPEKLADHGYQPRVSGDGALFAYVSLDPRSWDNQLFIANADGTDAHQVPLTNPSPPTIIDSPIFSADNKSILFSAPVGMRASAPSWVDKLLGITVASADGALLSDWWSVPLSGGRAKQVTNLQTNGLYASFSPDKKYIACFSGNGVFVMRPDGTGVAMLVFDTGGIAGTVSWIP